MLHPCQKWLYTPTLPSHWGPSVARWKNRTKKNIILLLGTANSYSAESRSFISESGIDSGRMAFHVADQQSLTTSGHTAAHDRLGTKTYLWSSHTCRPVKKRITSLKVVIYLNFFGCFRNCDLLKFGDWNMEIIWTTAWTCIFSSENYLSGKLSAQEI